MKTRFILLTAISLLGMSCSRKTIPLPEPEVMNAQDLTLKAESMFHQGQYVSNALSLVPRDSDGLLVFGFFPDYVSLNCRYSAPKIIIRQPNQTLSTKTVPGGEYETQFHFEVPMTFDSILPDEFLEVESVLIDGAYFLSITLTPDFPFTKARLDDVKITFPSWIDKEYHQDLQDHQLSTFFETFKPGQVIRFQTCSRKAYPLQEGEGLRTEDHRLVIDNTIVIDGTIRVDEADRKDPAGKGSPWSATFLTGWETTGGQIAYLTGKMKLDRTLKGHFTNYSEIPDFFKWKGLVLDLDDFHGEVRIKNETAFPISVSGVLMGDEREYPFGAANGQTPVWAPVGKGEYHVFLSEKGGRVKEDGQYTDRMDLPTPGFSGLIDEDPVSFALKDCRLSNDPQQTIRFTFDQDNWILVKGIISSSMMVGKDFQFQTAAFLAEIPQSKSDVVKLTGSMLVSNSFPFDFDILPVLYDKKSNQVPTRFDRIHIPAGTRETPAEAPVNIDWESHDPVSARYLVLELSAHTGKGREGESLYKDQRLAIGEVSFQVY